MIDQSADENPEALILSPAFIFRADRFTGDNADRVITGPLKNSRACVGAVNVAYSNRLRSLDNDDDIGSGAAHTT